MTNQSEWRIKLNRQAEKDLRKLPRSSLPRVYAALNKLTQDPTLGEPLTGNLSGARSLHFTLPGSGQHRAAYFVITDDRTVLVFAIGSRENFYREAERRVRSLRIEPRDEK
jgi:mRNA-degrading endonuclease RelE of RelBE toxin-antitoxin system